MSRKPSVSVFYFLALAALLVLPVSAAPGAARRAQSHTSTAGRLGEVIAHGASIRSAPAKNARVISVCPKGQYLALLHEFPSYYTVLMIGQKRGYVEKKDVKLLPYEVDRNTRKSLSSKDSLSKRLTTTALSYLGKSSTRPGNASYDAHRGSFVQAVYQKCGVKLPASLCSQTATGYSVPISSRKQWIPGDRLYFILHNRAIDRAGLYLGNNRFIYASPEKRKIVEGILGSPHARHLVAVRRSTELLASAQP